MIEKRSLQISFVFVCVITSLIFFKMPYKKASSYGRFNVAAFMKQRRLQSTDTAVAAAVLEKDKEVCALKKKLKRLDDKVRGERFKYPILLLTWYFSYTSYSSIRCSISG